MSGRSRTLVAGKETVVRRHGADWSFHLPEQHAIEITPDKRYVTVSTPLEGSLYAVERIDDSDPEEVVVYLGEEHGKSGPTFSAGDQPVPPVRGYPLPEIQDEFARLKVRWLQAGRSEQEFTAYPQGATHEDQLRRIRKRLRACEDGVPNTSS
jgi:hypothetical protein